jgi:hypothetical protein
MAGPEPYPQEKWSIEQERAYAEGRSSAQAGNGKGSASRSKSAGKKRIVRTAEGARRYKVPIGAEIGTARNAKAAEAQKDTESTGRYGELVGQDQAAQARALGGLSPDQLQRLSRVAYSFPSSNPAVVRLRIGVANELRKRGMNVNDFGGLGGGVKTPGPRPKPKKKAATGAAPGSHSTEGIKAAMSRVYGKGKSRNLSMPQLRSALKAFGKMAPDKREVVAKYLVGQAIELGMPDMLGHAVLDASGMRAEVLELAGRWKHGYIPLDSVALASKMKGKTGGKKWWTGGGGSGGTKGKLHDGIGVPKSGGSTSPRKSLGNLDTGGKYAAKPARKPGVSGKPANLRRSIEAGKQVRASKDRTAVVKSSPEPERGSKMNKGQPIVPEFKKRYGGMSESELKAAQLDARKRAETDVSASTDLRMIRAEMDRRESLSRDVAKAPKTTSEAPKAASSEPFPAAASYLEKHGASKTREKLTALKTKRDNLKVMRRKTASVDLEIKGLEHVLARESSGKA